jgi:hypothetical protein
MLKPPSKCRRIELHFVTLQDKINYSKYQHQQFITNLLETIIIFFFTRLTIDCKRSVQHI